MVYQQKWHVVTVGKKPGVYSSWIEAGPNTKNIPGGAIYQSFTSEDEAIRTFEAARARGEVQAYPHAGKKDKSTGKSKNAPLSPLGVEASLLRAPLYLNGDAESTEFQTPLSSPAHSRVAKLRRTLRDSSAKDSCSTSSSPPTCVTTRVYAPLYEEDSPPRPSPHFTFTSSSSRAYPVVFDGRLLEIDTEDMPLQLEVSDWDSPSPTPLFSDLHPGAEEHTPKPPRCMPLHPDPPSRSIGVEYRNLSDLTDMGSVDSRIWLPKSRVFDPYKVKPRPLTRPPSPEKRNTTLLSSHETVNSPQVRRQISSVDSPFVRTDRGRPSKLTASSSLPILPDWELEDECLGCGSYPTQLLGNYRTGKGREKEPDHSVRDRYLAERPGYGPNPRNDGRSHVQLVARDGRDDKSAIIVHCPPNCPHETCYRSPLASESSVPGIEPSRHSGPRYVDACVSPITTATGCMQSTNSPAKIRSKGPYLDGDHRDGLAGFTYISHLGIALEADVRSPIVKGTMVPINAVETPFGRPSPPVRVSNCKSTDGTFEMPM
ncbi:hypothetical protein OG21DRAFT_1506662 [Imleria badia]|nr:hypothetical protein OG21DRAFT_1506662 [Imleria badia]